MRLKDSYTLVVMRTDKDNPLHINPYIVLEDDGGGRVSISASDLDMLQAFLKEAQQDKY
jgi:hypothetical protein